jgi:ribonuclease P protein component
MIVKAHRFHGLTSLRLVYSRGQTVRGSALAVKYLLNTRRRAFRAAVVVSRKVHKSAVVRNRIRRRVYEIIRQLEPRITESFDIVVSIYSDQVATMPAAELRALLVGQLQKAGVLAPASGSGNKGRAIVDARE